jgi:hypothetical protein
MKCEALAQKVAEIHAPGDLMVERRPTIKKVGMANRAARCRQ